MVRKACDDVPPIPELTYARVLIPFKKIMINFNLNLKNSLTKITHYVKNIINFPSVNHNTQFQGCHLIRNKSLNHYPDIFKIQDYWINCSIEGKLYGYETVSVNPHVGTKELYLKNQY